MQEDKDLTARVFQKRNIYLVAGWFASVMSAGMYLSQIDQIRINISGQKGSFFLPLFTVLSCVGWVLYGYLKPQKDWPILFCCSLGVVFGIITTITAL